MQTYIERSKVIDYFIDNLTFQKRCTYEDGRIIRNKEDLLFNPICLLSANVNFDITCTIYELIAKWEEISKFVRVMSKVNETSYILTLHIGNTAFVYTESTSSEHVFLFSPSNIRITIPIFA